MSAGAPALDGEYMPAKRPTRHRVWGGWVALEMPGAYTLCQVTEALRGLGSSLAGAVVLGEGRDAELTREALAQAGVATLPCAPPCLARALWRGQCFRASAVTYRAS